uniref:Uncharacterized protein n=1 Tax=viral metagenome TaxID=1070528 RepID=A0A6C0AC63_9ZZZZ
MDKSLPKVIFLLDDEENSSYLNEMYGLSVHKDRSWEIMCLRQTKAQMQKIKLFRFTKMSLLVEDKKMNDYIKTNDGVVVFISDEKLKTQHKKIMTRLKELSKILDKHTPLFIYVFGNTALVQISKSIEATTPFRQVYRYEFYSVPTFNGSNNKMLEFSKLLTINNKDISHSKTLSDEELLEMFETKTLPINSWDHYGRLRVVYLSIKKKTFLDTINQKGWLCTHWKSYKKSIGHGNLWNFSLTRFWASIIYLIDEKGEYYSFDAFYEANPKLHRGSLFKEYYGEELFTDEAKNNWLPPTKQKITNILK